jgi:hypothetical protein
MVQVKLPGALEVNTIFGLDPLQILFVAGFVTTGVGLTVTTKLYGDPTHDPVVEVGVTRYSTVPAVELLKLVRIWFIIPPEPPAAPVTLPVIAPTVHVKLLGVLAVNAIFGLVPLQILTGGLVTDGFGLTVTVIV